jgi:LysR family glycine cleavage system transcriptional activator
VATRKRLQGLSLTALRAFEAAARHSSFKDAGVELGVTLSAVSLSVKMLEAQLGVALFERRAPAGLALTKAGSLLARVLRSAFDDIEGGLSTLKKNAPLTVGRLKDRASSSTAATSRPSRRSSRER